MTTRGRALRVRRAPHLVAYWRTQTLVACNYATGARVEVPPKARDLLSYCDDWTKLDDLERAGFVSSSSFAATIERLVELALLERSDRPVDPRVSAMATLDRWNPQAGFFHATTKDVPFVSPTGSPHAARARLRQPRLLLRPSSATPGRETIDFRRPDARRRPGERAARAPHVASLLVATGHARRARDDPGRSAGVQQWVEGERSLSRSRRLRPAARATPPNATWSLETSRD